VNSARVSVFKKRAGGWPRCACPQAIQIGIIILATTASTFLLAADAPQQPSISEVLPVALSLGPGWERKNYLLFDSVALPSEIIQTASTPPQSALENWRHGVQAPDGTISGWVLAHYHPTSDTNGLKYEVHLERYRSHDALQTDFDRLLETAVTQPASKPLKTIGDVALLVANSNGAATKVWFRRGDFRAWISPIGVSHNWDQDASLRLLAQVIDQRIAGMTMNMRGVEDGAVLLKHAMEDAIRSSNPSAVTPQQVVKVGGAFIPISKPPSSNSVSFAFEHWGRKGPDGTAPAVFRLTNSDFCSILLWNVRVQNPANVATAKSSSWSTVQDDYPSATSAVCEAGSTIEFWVSKPLLIPWRVCILYSRELSESDRPKDSQRSWGGNYEVIGQPFH
jgi:hypothetical protein